MQYFGALGPSKRYVYNTLELSDPRPNHDYVNNTLELLDPQNVTYTILWSSWTFHTLSIRYFGALGASTQAWLRIQYFEALGTSTQSWSRMQYFGDPESSKRYVYNTLELPDPPNVTYTILWLGSDGPRGLSPPSAGTLQMLRLQYFGAVGPSKPYVYNTVGGWVGRGPGAWVTLH